MNSDSNQQPVDKLKLNEIFKRHTSRSSEKPHLCQYAFITGSKFMGLFLQVSKILT